MKATSNRENMKAKREGDKTEKREGQKTVTSEYFFTKKAFR